METKIELLKKLGFSNDYLKYISDEVPHSENLISTNQNFAFDELNVFPTEIVYPVIDKTSEPINGYINKS